MKQIILGFLMAALFLSSACRSEPEIQAQNEPNRTNSAIDNKEAAQKTEKITNINDGLKFNDEKPAILSIINSEKLNLKAVGLRKGQVMSKHKAGLKSLVIVLEGKIEFVIGDEKFVLNKLDTYEIPVNVEHEIRAIEESIFSLTQEK